MTLEKNALEKFNFELNLSVGDLCKLSERISIQLTQTNFHSHVYLIFVIYFFKYMFLDSSRILTAEKITKGIESRPSIRQYSCQSNLNNSEIKLDFKKIGGLHSVKQRLVEIFIWPIKVKFYF